MENQRPLSLYIHWPFCVSKCPYCDFNSHVRERVDMARWRRALLADMAHEAQLTKGRRLVSIFFGGGTPSLMPPGIAADLIAQAQQHWQTDAQIEITLEANPSSVEARNFAALAKAGVNRLSLGIQSLDNDALQFLGRAHNVDEALGALEIARQNFARISMDLIYARPGQSISAWQDELSRALALGCTHMSLYQLTIEPGTRFATLARTGALHIPDDDQAAELWDVTQQLCDDAALSAYETSNHARTGDESRHNLAYWRYDDYLGIGPGAHGRRLAMASQRHKKPENYLAAIERNGHGLCEEMALSDALQAREALLMGLRLAEGVELAQLAARFALAQEALVDFAAIERLQDQGLVERAGTRLRTSRKGALLLNAILAEIVIV